MLVRYQVYVQGHGWMDWVRNGQLAGTTGKELRIEALRNELARACPAKAGLAEPYQSGSGFLSQVWTTASRWRASSASAAGMVLTRVSSLLKVRATRMTTADGTRT